MKKPRRKQDFINKPTYPGGSKALKEFLAKNKRYPAEAIKHKVEGSVLVKYSVSQAGKVVAAAVIEGVGYGCDEEALRIVQLLKFKKVKNRGVIVTSNFKITIHFRLKEIKQVSISYSLKKVGLKTTEPVYNYSITLPDKK